MNRPDRNPIRQNFVPFSVPVLVTPTPLAQAGVNSALSALYTGILISVPTGGVPVWFGNSSIQATSANGLEISPGVPVFLGLQFMRQLYEVQSPLVDQFCKDAFVIPLPVWDVSQIYLAATGASQLCGVILFPEPYK